MPKFVNLAADLSNWNILEARMQAAVLLEDGLNRPLVNVFHYHKTAGSTVPNLEVFANNMVTALQTAFQNVMNERVTDILFSVRPLDDPTVTEVTQSVGAGAGVIAGDPLSEALAAVITLDTGVRGRNFRGRKHIGGLSESQSTGGDELAASPLGVMQTLATALLTSINGDGGNDYTLCVLSSTLSRVTDTPPYFTGADVVLATAQKILGTMRRRKERIPS